MFKHNLQLVVSHPMGPPANTLGAQLEEFSHWLIVHRAINANTIGGYVRVVKKFLRDRSTLMPTQRQVEDHIVSLHQGKYSYHHIVNSSIALEWYMVFIGRPMRLGRPKKPKRVIKYTLTEAEVALILAATRNIREKAILTLLAYSGIRNAELCRLRVCDVDFGNNVLRIFAGKDAKDRVVCVSGECIKILLVYLHEHPRGENDYLFTTIEHDEQYTKSALRKLVKTVATRAKIAKRVYPHLFRHSLATNMLNRGANLMTIQNQLGHAHVETTMIYVTSRWQRIQAEYQMFAPGYL